ncbi:MAG: tetratricopeptide repeat protein [Gemmataceae bacterium]
MSALDRMTNALGWLLQSRLRLLLAMLLVLSSAWLGWMVLERVQVYRLRARAESVMGAFDFKGALSDIEAAIYWRPGEAGLWLLGSQAARRDGNLDEAARFLKEYRRLAGSTPEGRLESALLEAQKGDIETHVYELLPKVDAGHPAAEQILEAFTVGAVEVYRFDQAGFWIHHLLEKFPRNPVGRLTKARMDDVMNKKERALETCRALVEDFPDNYGARLLLAGLTVRAQKYQDASQVYQSLLNDHPGDLKSKLGLVKCLTLMGENEKAENLANQMAQDHPESGDALLEASRLAQGSGKMEMAAEMLEKAAQLSPNDHEIHYQLSLCLERLGRKEEARHHLELFRKVEAEMVRLDTLLKEVVNNPKDPKPRLEAGKICLRNGQPDEGIRWLQGALEIAPNDASTHAALADFYQSVGDENLANFHRQRAR